MTKTKICNKCGVEHPVTYFYKNSTKAHGVQGECKDCWRVYDAEHRMYLNGKRVNKTHPLWKPGRYKTLDDAWSHTEIDNKTVEGHVYVVSNKAWQGWYKVGKAVKSEDRLNNYQTSSPHRDYVLEYQEAFDNRNNAETIIHECLRSKVSTHKNEWFYTDLQVITETIQEVKYINARSAKEVTKTMDETIEGFSKAQLSEDR